MSEETWRKFRNREYRSAFALAMLRNMFPFQLRAVRRARRLTQEQVANDAGLTQGVISRAGNSDYGNLTINTIGRIAAGLDLAVIIRLVPFSELEKYASCLDENEFAQLKSFDEEDKEKSAS